MSPDRRPANHLGKNSGYLCGASFGTLYIRPFLGKRFLPSPGMGVQVLLVFASIICVIAGTAAASAAVGQPSISQGFPVADALTVEDDGEKARLVFSISQPVAAQAFVLANPDRLIIDLPQILFQIDPEPGKPRFRRQTGSNPGLGRSQALIGSFRFGLLAPNKSRIVIDLNQPARLIHAASEPGSPDNADRLVIELKKTDLTSFLQAAQAARLTLLAKAEAVEAQAANEAKLATPPLDPLQETRPVIVIDPGHGGVDSGAIGKGFIEKDLVFEFANMLRQKLEASGRFKIIMTRDSDIFIPLGERVKIAREANAGLFISIHADSLPEGNENVGGATVYTASARASDAEAARVAESENKADAIAGLDSREDANEVTGILFDLARRETRTFSHVFARTLVNYWKVAARLNKNPQRSARFQVLRAPDVPSVLLELGYLSNSKDSLAINSPEWREKASEQVMDAVQDYFASRAAPPAAEFYKPAVGEAPREAPDLRELIGEDEASGSGHLAAGMPPKTR